MSRDPDGAWDADESYLALHPQNSGEASPEPTSSILEAAIACVLAIIAALFMIGLIASGTVWWLDASDCGAHATWMDGGCP